MPPLCTLGHLAILAIVDVHGLQLGWTAGCSFPLAACIALCGPESLSSGVRLPGQVQLHSFQVLCPKYVVSSVTGFSLQRLGGSQVLWQQPILFWGVLYSPDRQLERRLCPIPTDVSAAQPLCLKPKEH